MKIESGPFQGLTKNRYRVIYADPPWHYITRSPKGRDRSPEYKTMNLDDIKALPVRDLAAKDCVLFMWVIDSHVQFAQDVIRAWGFTYKTVGFYWSKTNLDGSPFMGGGFWTRANPESCFEAYLGEEQEVERCFLNTIGRPKRQSKAVRRLITSPRREHSRKPDEVRERIEALVDGPYIELFARSSAPAWVAWGDQTGRFSASRDTFDDLI